MKLPLVIRALLCGLAIFSSLPGDAAQSALQQEVADTERAFAKSMADRDLKAFSSFLSAEAIFFSGPTPLHGKQQVTDWWARFFQQADAPFSWEPEQVEVIESGQLALSTGPVKDRQGKLIGSFTSIWRQEKPGVWRIIFDKGNEVCRCEAEQK
ncbi:nuclear transport factor 2 family protein [Undibacterium sp. Jales W-56]|uniref:YybH family protein n=1 Tax=Undibacterium sp. Jales W-56 TaxID=2897325 RepID=UPI0021D3203F|nr:nuclear transport factor 2 family protein [Undibacterium sp. Jales W-56]MCU6434219.1 nuclear transport factor 2 family protein [Undibacterium sp. Jales W-56]